MKFSAVAAVILAGSAAAAPGTALRQARAAKRTARHGNPIQYVQGPSSEQTNKTDVSYSSNWAGAVLVGTGYTSVTGTFTAPTPSTAGSGSAWVGIDGDTCGTAILQTGIDWTKSGNSISYDAWYEWYPDYAYDFSGISISAGDSIKVTVTATSKTAGSATVENLTKGKSVTHTFNGGVDGDLCEYNAEWIVEDFEEGNSLVEFANFGSVTFTDAHATKSGETVGVTGSTIIDLEQGSTVLTEVSLSGSSSVIIKYT
nr:acid protease 1 [Monilinia polystroma]UOW65850.1 acid protease 1 [Monilinia polystroma]UOW65851.1 acid protease 1 [Monilinia polystroma]UOW65852.1 acid protease 1 [Monilinia polystroma]UOW65853.1 acid protease 1 [Monilinia polystroma]